MSQVGAWVKYMAFEYSASLSDGSFWGVKLQHTQNNIIEKENKHDSLLKNLEKQKDIKQSYSKCSQNQGHLIYSILQPADILGKRLTR